MIGGILKNDEKKSASESSGVPWYIEIVSLVILLQIFLFCLEGAIDFRNSLNNNGNDDIILWAFSIWFKVKISIFLSVAIIGWKNRAIFSWRIRQMEENKTGFVPKHIEVMQFSYNIPVEKLYICVGSVIQSLAYANEKGMTATYVILITDNQRDGGMKGKNDIQEIHNIVKDFVSEKLQVIVQHQEDGKRDAFGKGFGILEKNRLSQKYNAGEIVFVAMDGDSEIPSELRESFFSDIAFPLSEKRKFGAITTHNYAEVDSNSPWVKHLYHLRFLRRFFMMSAITNVLTGRCSAFLGSISRDPEFRDILVNDLINHTNIGKERILDGNPLSLPFRVSMKVFRSIIALPKQVFETRTGDDKSTMYHVMKKGYEVLFHHSIYIICHEDLPVNKKWLPNVWFFQLPAFAIRYCRNTMNNNPRLLELGAKQIGWFRYMIIFMDRYLFWTPIVGFMTVPFLVAVYGTGYVYVYMSWSIAVTTFMTFVICISANKIWSPFYPPLLYNEHTALVLVKIWSVIDGVSSWTRQDGKKENSGAFVHIFLFFAIIIIMFTTIGILSGILKIPTIAEISTLWKL